MQYITHDRVNDPTITPRVEECRYLLQWTGALVRGKDQPIATDSPDTVPEKRLSDWKNKPAPAAPVENPILQPKPVPDDTATQIRDRLDAARRAVAQSGRLNLDKLPPTSTPLPASIARPNLAAAFDQFQNKARYRTDNPVLNELNLKTFRRNFYSLPDVEYEPYYCGIAWALAQITAESMGFKLIQTDRVIALRHAAIDIAWGHLVLHKPLEILEAILEQFQIKAIEPLAQSVALKLKNIAHEQCRWADTALVPVLDTDGTVLRSLTLCNITTAYVAIQQLDQLAIDCHSFSCGAQGAVLRLQSLGQQLTPPDRV